MLILTLLLLMNVKPLSAQENFSWQEMNSFHKTAMKSFHSAEANKLQPAKDSAASILEKAKEWQASNVPADCNEAEVKPLLQILLQQCQAIYDAVAAKKPDKFLKPLVLKAHVTFHSIINKCK